MGCKTSRPLTVDVDMPIILGILFVLSGGLMLFWLPRYQRKVEAGEVRLDPSMPSFKALRWAAVGFVIFGLLSIVAWYFHLVDF